MPTDPLTACAVQAKYVMPTERVVTAETARRLRDEQVAEAVATERARWMEEIARLDSSYDDEQKRRAAAYGGVISSDYFQGRYDALADLLDMMAEVPDAQAMTRTAEVAAEAVAAERERWMEAVATVAAYYPQAQLVADAVVVQTPDV